MFSLAFSQGTMRRVHLKTAISPRRHVAPPGDARSNQRSVASR